MTTAAYLRGVHAHGWPRVDRHLWQPGFYDHIVRNEAELQRIRTYVENNPIALLEMWADRKDRADTQVRPYNRRNTCDRTGGHTGPPLHRRQTSARVGRTHGLNE